MAYDCACCVAAVDSLCVWMQASCAVHEGYDCSAPGPERVAGRLAHLCSRFHVQLLRKLLALVSVLLRFAPGWSSQLSAARVVRSDA